MLRRTALTGGAALACAALLAGPAAANTGFGDEGPDRLGSRPLQRGHHGSDVAELQRTLNRLHLRTAVTDRFDQATERGVRRYERREGMSVDGKVSVGQARGMRRRAGTLPFGARTLNRGDRGGDVRRLQKVLTELGIRTSADGVFGSRTETKVRRYERREGLRRDGRVSRGQARGMLRRAKRAGSQRRTAGSASEGRRWFPIAGRWEWGGHGSGFGERGGRHKGIDLFADCGTPLAAVESGRIVFKDVHSAAGHYVVLRGDESGEDYAYMHLQAPSPLKRYARVAVGERLGTVGRTGNASACHLHFEIWTAPGWYEGGSPYDPRPSLERWAEQTRTALRARR